MVMILLVPKYFNKSSAIGLLRPLDSLNSKANKLINWIHQNFLKLEFSEDSHCLLLTNFQKLLNSRNKFVGEVIIIKTFLATHSRLIHTFSFYITVGLQSKKVVIRWILINV